MGNKFAEILTAKMATWGFIGIILASCLIEIFGNAYGIFTFDKTMLGLNTALSLWAAIQGSIIMINQNQADAKRDGMLEAILKSNKKIISLEEKIISLEETIKASIDGKK